jgi:hypothetical protein
VSCYKFLTTDGDVRISNLSTKEVVDLGSPDEDFQEICFLDDRLSAITIPTHAVSDSVDKSKLQQVLRFLPDPRNTEDFWTDEIALIPIDRSVVEIEGWMNYDYVIFDSHAGRVLSSLDGSLDQAQIADQTWVAGTPRFKADPSGMNLTIVAVAESDGDYQATPELTITLKYRPRFAL